MNAVSPWLIGGLVLGLAFVPLLSALFRAMTIAVEDEEAVVVTSFGRLVRVLTTPGLAFFPTKILPWIDVVHVSLRRDYRTISDIHVNDSRGTTLLVSLLLEFRIVDPEKTLFHVAKWEECLQNLLCHTATSLLGNRSFADILCDRMALGELIRNDIESQANRWGIHLEGLYIAKVKLLPEVSRQIFDSVAARLERVKADIEERGRLRVAQLEADTSVRVAELVAEAKGQYPAAIGRALAALGAKPKVLASYMELYELSQLRPHRTTAFRGFSNSELKAAEAAMLVAPPPND